VAFVTDDLGHGGTQRQLWLTARALAGHVDTRVVVLTRTIDPYARRLAEDGVPVTVIPRRSRVDAARAAGLVRTLRDNRPDLVHGMLDASNAYAFLAARRLRVPIVLSLRSDRIGMRGARAAILRAMYRRANAVTVNSEAGRAFLSDGVGVAGDRIHLVPNIVEPAHAAVSQPDGPVVGCVGRLTEVKRFERVIDAVARVRIHHPDARMVVVGDGPCRTRLSARAQERGVPAEFTGEADDAAPHIARFSCLAISSAYEGLSNVALEALAMGVPVVTLPAGDLGRLVVDGATGAVVGDDSEAAFAAAIERVLSDKSLRETVAREGPRLVRERFAPERAREALLAVYTRLCK